MIRLTPPNHSYKILTEISIPTSYNIYIYVYINFFEIEFCVCLHSSIDTTFSSSKVVSPQNRNMMGYILDIQDRTHLWPFSNSIEIKDCMNNKFTFCIFYWPLYEKGRNRVQIAKIFDYFFTYTLSVISEAIGQNVIIIHHLHWKFKQEGKRICPHPSLPAQITAWF